MIIQTRYRDIPWEEAKKCCVPEIQADWTPEKWDARKRGTPVQIITPPVHRFYASSVYRCDGPWYAKVGGNGVCIHHVEIGD